MQCLSISWGAISQPFQLAWNRNFWKIHHLDPFEGQCVPLLDISWKPGKKILLLQGH